MPEEVAASTPPEVEIRRSPVRERRESRAARARREATSPEHPLAPARDTTAKRSWRAERQTRRMRARKVTRVIRHIDPFSVLKAALVFFFCMWVILLVTGVLLWRVSVESGVIDNIESFIRDTFVEKEFTLNGDALFRAYAVGGLLMVLISTGFAVLVAVLFNLISDLVGGIRMTVVQEETAREADY